MNCVAARRADIWSGIPWKEEIVEEEHEVMLLIAVWTGSLRRAGAKARQRLFFIVFIDL